MNNIKQYADLQWYELNRDGDADGMIGIVHDGVLIVNPWIDPTGRFPLTDEEAIETYGETAIQQFCGMVIDRFGGNIPTFAK